MPKISIPLRYHLKFISSNKIGKTYGSWNSGVLRIKGVALKNVRFCLTFNFVFSYIQLTQKGALFIGWISMGFKYDQDDRAHIKPKRILCPGHFPKDTCCYWGLNLAPNKDSNEMYKLPHSNSTIRETRRAK